MRISDWSSDVCSSDLTCSVPTEAWAYQVPSVPCLWKISVRRRVYSARSVSWTAQSSTKDTGFPSDFIDIMMLRPCLRTSQICFRSEEHTSELQSLMRNSYAVFCLKKKINN